MIPFLKKKVRLLLFIFQSNHVITVVLVCVCVYNFYCYCVMISITSYLTKLEVSSRQKLLASIGLGAPYDQLCSKKILEFCMCLMACIGFNFFPSVLGNSLTRYWTESCVFYTLFEIHFLFEDVKGDRIWIIGSKIYQNN